MDGADALRNLPPVSGADGGTVAASASRSQVGWRGGPGGGARRRRHAALLVALALGIDTICHRHLAGARTFHECASRMRKSLRLLPVGPVTMASPSASKNG